MNLSGRIGKTYPIESLGEIPPIAVLRALEAFDWALYHGRDEQESMLRARTAFRMASRDHGRALGMAFHGERNRRCLALFDLDQRTIAGMRGSLELDVALGVKEAAEERRHAKAREDADRDAAIMRKVQEGR